MTGYIIGVMVACPLLVALVLSWSFWYSRTHRSFRERLNDGRPRRTGSWGWGWSFISLSIGAASFAFGCYMIAQQLHFMLNASPIIDARIVNYEYVHTRANMYYSPIVSFTTRDGKHLVATTLNSVTKMPQTGAVTKIQYEIPDPAQVELVVSDDTWFGPVVLVIFGVFFLGAAIAFSPLFERMRGQNRSR